MKEHISLQAAYLITAMVVASCLRQPAFAQTYKVGVPVCDTINTRGYYVHYNDCGPFDCLRFKLSHPTVVPYVTGLNFQIIVTETNGRIWSNLSDTVRVGDILTLPALPDTGVLNIYLAQFSSFRFLTRVVGTPMVAYENYYCKIGQAFSTGMCGNYVDHFGAGQICQVQPAVSVEDKDETSLPFHFQLLQNYPNPFNTSTTIQFDLNRPSEVRLKVFNLHGEEIATLINQKQFGAGRHKINWNAGNLPSGIYIYRLHANGEKIVAFKKLILLK